VSEGESARHVDVSSPRVAVGTVAGGGAIGRCTVFARPPERPPRSWGGVVSSVFRELLLLRKKAMPPDSSIEWLWWVTPLVSGEHSLVLTVEARLDVAGGRH
jgi:hypothetical protein